MAHVPPELFSHLDDLTEHIQFIHTIAYLAQNYGEIHITCTDESVFGDVGALVLYHTRLADRAALMIEELLPSEPTPQTTHETTKEGTHE